MEEMAARLNENSKNNIKSNNAEINADKYDGNS